MYKVIIASRSCPLRMYYHPSTRTNEAKIRDKAVHDAHSPRPDPLRHAECACNSANSLARTCHVVLSGALPTSAPAGARVRTIISPDASRMHPVAHLFFTSRP